jgi:uncharacterized membrane protein (DUF2068 family)
MKSGPGVMISDRDERQPEPGLNLVIFYKFAKSIIEILIGGAFLVLGSAGLAKEFAKIAQFVRHHAAQAWSISLAERLIDVSTVHNIFVIALALIFDGVLTGFEGWALRRGYVWSRWLVVVTTASLLPFEVLGSVRHPSAGRVFILLANILVVVYLVKSQISSRNDRPATSP